MEEKQGLQVGDKIPNETVSLQDGKELKFSDLEGDKVILYFYPKDNTPGCTAEACSLRDSWGELKKLGYKVYGVSADTAESHKKFIEKNKLPFSLIVDTDKRIIQKFGVWGEKKMAERTYDGILRTTFIIDEKGIITHIIGPKQIKTKDHASQIIQLLSDDEKK